MNKKEACLIHSSQDQVNKPGFKAFWDGGCKDGYAYGLGRDIAIADDGFHIEEISTYSDKGINDGPVEFIDFQKKFIVKGVCYNDGKRQGAEFERYGVSETYEPWLGHDGYTTLTKALFYSSPDSDAALLQSPTAVDKILLRRKGGVLYRKIDMTGRPQSLLDPALYTYELLSPNGKLGGVAGAKYKSGKFIAFKIDGIQTRPVNAPSAYFEPFNKAFQKADQLVRFKASGADKQAIKMVDQYLKRICNNPKVAVPVGITKEKYLEICTYESELKAEVNKAVVVAERELELAKAEAAIELAENKRKFRVRQKRITEAEEDSVHDVSDAIANGTRVANTVNQKSMNSLFSVPSAYGDSPSVLNIPGM